MDLKDLGKPGSAVRKQMLTEAASGVGLYVPTTLTAAGQKQWPGLVQQAIDQHNHDWLAQQISGLLNPTDKSGKKMASDAHTKLAHGEFNRYYIRGVCLEAQKRGQQEVTVYRAGTAADPRPDSERLVGTKVSAADLLDDLRSNAGKATKMGIPSGPNSQISVHL